MFGLPTFCGTASDETPTAEEIEIRSAEVRANWTPAEEARRAVGRARGRYEIPSYMTKRTHNAKMPVYVGEVA